MGRTVATFTQIINQAIGEWQPYRRALRKEDQEAFDDLFGHARYHAAEGSYLSRSIPFETMLISMLIEEHKALLALKERVRELEDRIGIKEDKGLAL